ncbi:hypothetical protein QAD02_001629 [Eretmocerus hayati]|uniref:Uncharacterized protein n=1 Tax=Eretmocerus hayati TaxID=131215 RepID=A0ACC2NGS8_9HYME|nr:hypothetical protein QAD02_001629 [Eretmocerus hayati]
MLRQLDRCVRATYRELEAAYGSGDTETVHKLGDELVNLVSLSEEPRQNQVEAYRYLAMKQVALGRHDRALELASKMLFLAKSGTNDIELIVRALTTLGKVHLSFGHVNALVREWERLVDDIKSVRIYNFDHISEFNRNLNVFLNLEKLAGHGIGT